MKTVPVGQKGKATLWAKRGKQHYGPKGESNTKHIIILSISG